MSANEYLETSVAGIYALGDVKGGPAFTHISYDDYRIVAANLLEGVVGVEAELDGDLFQNCHALHQRYVAVEEARAPCVVAAAIAHATQT